MSADAWDNFIASLDPAAVEAERMRVHGDLDQERPGSRADHEMKFAHDYVRNDFWARMRGERIRRTVISQIEDADREIRARGFDLDGDDHDIEAAIRSYSQQHRKAAA
ncbi:hypothetical protein [Curtobacterium sp. MCBA15_004]|uniref:hypothetical protein n=1 Tax=Curtobacterium sp. MCBA15_004 TaxID=1898733 RepID=UPI0008DE4F3B|nr:hypothetical protein [Curtobacterium sp. MCBA15_004]WIA95821.1 hypothetical protein QOL16_11950 [Curtobacterium sp. MCBA15_004]